MYLHVSIPPASPGLSENYSAPDSQQQPRHHAAMEFTKVICDLFYGQDSHVRGLKPQETLLCLVCTRLKNAGMHGEKHLARVQAHIHAAGDHLVGITLVDEITSASRAPWRRALEREGRALASAVQRTRLSMRKTVIAGCPGEPGRRPVARAWPSRHPTSAVAADCGWLQCNSGIGRVKKRYLKPDSPETQATNGNFEKHEK